MELRPFMALMIIDGKRHRIKKILTVNSSGLIVVWFFATCEFMVCAPDFF